MQPTTFLYSLSLIKLILLCPESVFFEVMHHTPYCVVNNCQSYYATDSSFSWRPVRYLVNEECLWKYFGKCGSTSMWLEFFFWCGPSGGKCKPSMTDCDKFLWACYSKFLRLPFDLIWLRNKLDKYFQDFKLHWKRNIMLLKKSTMLNNIFYYTNTSF